LPLVLRQEPRPGKNRALNAALPALAGDLVVFTDDDVLPAPDWLRQWRTCADAHPEAAMFGGSVALEWPTPPPAWLRPEALPFDVLYAQNLRPSGPCGPHEIYGPNMAVRAGLFGTGLRFAEGVGPDATNPRYAMGSETELLRRLAEAGHRGWFCAEAVVRHIIRPEQMREDWVLARGFRYGTGAGRRHAGHLLTGPRLGGMPAALALRLAAYGVLAPLAGLLPPGPLRLRLRWRERELAGIAASLRDETLQPRGTLACT
jgi:glycosyltransferase involved in cell wall biosynthesis